MTQITRQKMKRIIGILLFTLSIFLVGNKSVLAVDQIENIFTNRSNSLKKEGWLYSPTVPYGIVDTGKKEEGNKLKFFYGGIQTIGKTYSSSDYTLGSINDLGFIATPVFQLIKEDGMIVHTVYSNSDVGLRCFGAETYVPDEIEGYNLNRKQPEKSPYQEVAFFTKKEDDLDNILLLFSRENGDLFELTMSANSKGSVDVFTKVVINRKDPVYYPMLGWKIDTQMDGSDGVPFYTIGYNQGAYIKSDHDNVLTFTILQDDPETKTNWYAGKNQEDYNGPFTDWGKYVGITNPQMNSYGLEAYNLPPDKELDSSGETGIQFKKFMNKVCNPGDEIETHVAVGVAPEVLEPEVYGARKTFTSFSGQAAKIKGVWIDKFGSKGDITYKVNTTGKTGSLYHYENPTPSRLEHEWEALIPEKDLKMGINQVTLTIKNDRPENNVNTTEIKINLVKGVEQKAVEKICEEADDQYRELIENVPIDKATDFDIKDSFSLPKNEIQEKDYLIEFDVPEGLEYIPNSLTYKKDGVTIPVSEESKKLSFYVPAGDYSHSNEQVVAFKLRTKTLSYGQKIKSHFEIISDSIGLHSVSNDVEIQADPGFGDLKVEYRDKETQQLLSEKYIKPNSVTTTGKIGSSYTIDKKSIPWHQFVEADKPLTGIYQAGQTVVTLYYLHTPGDIAISGPSTVDFETHDIRDYTKSFGIGKEGLSVPLQVIDGRETPKPWTVAVEVSQELTSSEQDVLKQSFIFVKPDGSKVALQKGSPVNIYNETAPERKTYPLSDGWKEGAEKEGLKIKIPKTSLPKATQYTGKLKWKIENTKP